MTFKIIAYSICI